MKHKAKFDHEHRNILAKFYQDAMWIRNDRHHTDEQIKAKLDIYALHYPYMDWDLIWDLYIIQYTSQRLNDQLTDDKLELI